MSRYAPIKLAYEVIEPEVRTNLNDIIFIHALSLSKIGWNNKLTKKIADHTGRRAYSLDMRNHGESEWSEDFNIDIMVKDVLHFMDDKGIKQAVLIGQSMGAKVSMDLALAQPGRVEKLVLEDFGPKALSDSVIEMVTGYLSLMKKATEQVPPDASYKEANKIVLEFIFKNLPEDIRNKEEQLVKENLETVELALTKRGGRWVVQANINFLLKWIQTKDAFGASKGLCTKPALFIYGTLSPMKVNEEKELITKLFPNAKLHSVEGASHTVHNDCPDEFCQVVLQFLSNS